MVLKTLKITLVLVYISCHAFLANMEYAYNFPFTKHLYENFRFRPASKLTGIQWNVLVSIKSNLPEAINILNLSF
jgi:hypothetical protein